MHTKTEDKIYVIVLFCMCKVIIFLHDVAYSILLVWVSNMSQGYESSHMLLVLLQNLMISENFKRLHIINTCNDC